MNSSGVNRALVAALVASMLVVLAVVATPPCSPWARPLSIAHFIQFGPWCR